MRKIVVLTFVSLDGYMQAPGGKGEDPSGNFDLEGWTVPYLDEKLGQGMDRQMSMPFDLLLGRKTYDIFASYWPKRPETEVGKVFNEAVKYVVTKGNADTSWEQTVTISGDVVEELKKLKAGDGPVLQVHGSSELIQTLLENDLVDELWLKTFPVTLGKGKRLFGGGTMPAAYKLTRPVMTSNDVIVACYARNGEVKTGSFD
jgi:dihydrofolate reductase